MRNKNTVNMDIVVNWILWLTAFLAIACWLGGCNTMAGIGKDIQAAAKGVQNEMAPEQEVK